MDKLRVLIQSNSSRAVTGFGKAMKNLLLAFYDDPNIELIEAANGARYGADLKTPWESHGTYPNNPAILTQIQGDPEKERAAGYGFYTIDEIVEKVKPDVFLGVEDIWAFKEYTTKTWWGKIPCILWTTLDSVPILPLAEQMAPQCDKFFVWASFAEKAMKELGVKNVKTIHGPVNYENFYPLDTSSKSQLKEKHGLSEDFVIGFVFKNQLRKSAPNLLEGFKRFLEANPNSKAKLLLHSDWSDKQIGWDLPKYVKEKGIDPNLVLTTYLCKSCKEYEIKPYVGEDKPCKCCGAENSMVTKTTAFGVSEKQLNEIYNVMDVYCHPFTSGGQELPIQEAKATGLITLVTDYSCGTDAVGGDTGGLPLHWSEYREPYTDFIKATTDPDSICEQLTEIFNKPDLEKQELSKQSIKYVQDEYSVQSIVVQLKKELLEFKKTDFDFDRTRKPYNLDFVPDVNLSDPDWLISLYNGMCFQKRDESSNEIKHGLTLIAENNRKDVYNFIRNKAAQRNAETQQKSKSIEDFLGEEDVKERIIVVIPESAGDVLIVNGLLSNLQKLYSDKKIYVMTQPKFFDMINDHKDLAGLIPYQKNWESLLFLEGRGDHNGYCEIAFLPHILTQRALGYLHNNADKNVYNLLENI